MFEKEPTKKLTSDNNIFDTEDKNYKILFDINPELLAISDLETGRYIEVNKTFLKITGYSRQEVIGKTSTEIGILKEHQRVEILKIFKNGKIEDYESYITNKQGQKISGLFSAQIMEVENKKVLYSLFKEISKQKQFEKELKESKERYKELFYNSILPMMVIDPDTGCILETNTKANEFYGYTNEEFLKLKTFDINMLSSDKVQTLMRKAKSSNQNHFLFKHKLSTGEIRDVEVYSGTIMFENKNLLLSTISDVTDKLRIEKELRKSDENLRAVLDSTTDAYFLIDKNYLIINYNKVSEKYFSLISNKKLQKGISIFEFSYPGYNDQFIENFNKAIEGNIVSLERELYDLNGQRFWFKIKFMPVYNRNNEIYAVTLNLSEITDLKNTFEQLQRVYNIIEKSPVVIFLWKNESGWPVEYISVNCLQITGYSKNEFIEGKINYEQIIHPDNLDYVKYEIKKHSEKGDFAFEHKPYRIIRKDGKIRWIKDATTIRRDANGKVLFYEGIIVEITEQEEFKRALQISENRLNAAMDASEIGLWDWDLVNRRIYYSPGWCKILGYNENEISNKLSFWKDKIHRLDRKRTVDNIIYHLRNNSDTHQSEHRLKLKNNSYIWVLGKGRVIERDEKGRPIRVVGTIEDIDFRKRSEIALKESEEKYRKVLENIHLIGVILDKKGNIIFANKFLLNLTGWKKLEIMNKNWFDLFIPEENREQLRKIFSKAFCKKSDFPINNTNEIITKKGERKIISWSNTINYDHNKNLFSVTSIGEDITEQEMNRIALQINEERLKTAMDATEVGLWDWDCTTDNVYYSPGWANILGVQEEIMVNNYNFWKLRLHPEDKVSVLENLNAHLQMRTDAFYCEYRLHHQNGNWVWVLGKGKVIKRDKDNNPIRVIGTMEKINKRIYDTIINTEERERKRFAENLHDELGPLLSTAKLYVEALKYNKKLNITKDTLNKFEEIVEEAIERSQEIANNLSPHILKNFGLEAALKSFCSKISESKKINIDCHSSLKSRLKENIETSLYRVIIELINNTIKHANADLIRINLYEQDKRLLLNYEDNGIGFDTDQIFEKQKGMGLLNIFNRIEIINGKCQLLSKPNSGIKLEIMIPLL